MAKKEFPGGECRNTLENKVSREVGSEPEGAPSRGPDEIYEIDLVEVMLTLWKRRLIVLAAALCFVACAAAYVAVAPKIYESRATLAFLPGPGRNQPSPDSYLTLAGGDDLLDGVIKELSSGASEGALTVGALRKGLSVNFVQPDKSRRDQNPPAMTATFRAKDPETAATVLSVWTRLFIEMSKRLPEDRSSASLESLEKLLEATKKEFETTESRLLAHEKENLAPLLEIQLRTKEETYADLLAQRDVKNSAALNERLERIREEYEEINATLVDVRSETERLQRETKILSESCESLSMQYQQMKATIADAVSPLKLIEKPTVPRGPASPRRMRILGLALLLGLSVGVTAALLVEMFAKRKGAAL